MLDASSFSALCIIHLRYSTMDRVVHLVTYLIGRNRVVASAIPRTIPAYRPLGIFLLAMLEDLPRIIEVAEAG
jgi:hypothetical protein